MSTRTDHGAPAREAREQAEAREARRGAELRRIRVLGGIALVALLAVVVAIAAGGGGSSAKTKSGGRTIASLFAGIPQHGFTLGNPNAPATVEEFIDPQCPFCAQFSRQGLPTLLSDYVRTGKVKVVLRPLAFIGPDSQTAARVIAAAARQNLAWPYLDVLYANQGPENSGYVTDAFLRRVGGQVPRLDTAKALKVAQTDAAVTKDVTRATSRAMALKVTSTPTLVFSKAGGAPHALNVTADNYAGTLRQSLSAALGQ
jgi:protein-disulfide isomerase